MQNARQFEVLKISIHLYYGSHVGGYENAHHPIFLYNIIENSPTSFACNFVFVGPNDFKFGTEICCMPYQNLGQIDHNLRNHIFDDVTCKQPIPMTSNLHRVSQD